MGKTVDYNDFWYIKSNPITKAGVFPYLGKQIDPSLEPDKIYMVLRPSDEIEKAQETFKLLPLTDEHEMLGADFTPAEEKGIHGVTGEETIFKDGTLYTPIKIYSEYLKDEIEGGKKELSAGYFCKYDLTSGEYEGEHYDAIQRDLRGNHIALVENGRMGHDVRVMDSGLSFALDKMDVGKIIKHGENMNIFDWDESKNKADLSSKNHGKSGEDTAPDKENTQMDKREIIREIMAICAKPADQFQGGEEERERTIAGLAEKIAYNPSEAGKADDEDLDEGKKAVELIKDKAAGCDVEEDPKAVKEEKEQITVEDSMNAVLKMLGKREALYSKLTKHIGAFDHADMTEEDMAKYACKKLNIACDSGDDVCALLKGYLKGAETKAGEFVTIAKDSALEEKDNGFENYLKGK